MDMIVSRNLTSHTYNEDAAAHIVAAITGSYAAEYGALRDRLAVLRREKQ